MRAAVPTLRAEIVRFIGAGGLEMPDMREKAEACQRRIENLGYRWDPVRLLWRAPMDDSPWRSASQRPARRTASRVTRLAKEGDA